MCESKSLTILPCCLVARLFQMESAVATRSGACREIDPRTSVALIWAQEGV